METDYDFIGAATVKAGAGGDECSIDVNSAHISVDVKEEVDIIPNEDEAAQEALQADEPPKEEDSKLKELETKCLLLEQEVLLLKLELKRRK